MEKLDKSESVDDMITNLFLFTNKPFIKGKTFIFIDVIQEFKEITTKVKFRVEEGSFRYIFSGSFYQTSVCLQPYTVKQQKYRNFKLLNR